MSRRNHGIREGMSWVVGDATAMAIEDSAFDLVLDKSVLDTFACGDNSTLVVATFLKEVMRVLSDYGTYLCISYGAPDTRTNYMASPHLEWDMRTIELPPKYRCKKA